MSDCFWKHVLLSAASCPQHFLSALHTLQITHFSYLEPQPQNGQWDIFELEFPCRYIVKCQVVASLRVCLGRCFRYFLFEQLQLFYVTSRVRVRFLENSQSSRTADTFNVHFSQQAPEERLGTLEKVAVSQTTGSGKCLIHLHFIQITAQSFKGENLAELHKTKGQGLVCVLRRLTAGREKALYVVSCRRHHSRIHSWTKLFKTFMGLEEARD